MLNMYTKNFSLLTSVTFKLVIAFLFFFHPGQKHFIKLEFIVNPLKLIQGRITKQKVDKKKHLRVRSFENLCHFLYLIDCYRLLEVVSYSEALFLRRDSNHHNTCWRGKTTGHKWSGDSVEHRLQLPDPGDRRDPGDRGANEERCSAGPYTHKHRRANWGCEGWRQSWLQ